VKYNRFTQKKTECRTPSGPRSMTLSENEDYLYVVSYFDHSFSKIRTRDMELIESINTGEKPIGICGNWDESEIWVACYSGKIEVFKDFHLDSLKNGNSIFGIDLSAFWKTKSRKKEEVDASQVVDTTMEELEPDTLKVEEEVIIKESLTIPKNALKDVALKNESRFINRKILESAAECSYYVITGAFSVPENALKQKSEIDVKGYDCSIINGTKLTYVAPLCSETRARAEEQMKQLKATEGYSAWILKR